MPFGAFGGIQDFSWSSGGDTTMPSFVSAVWTTDGMRLDITYNEPLNESLNPAVGSFSFAGTTSVPASTDVNGTVVSVTPDIPVLQGETITVSYTAGVNPIQDLAGNNAADLVDQATTNNSTVQLAGVFHTVMASSTISSLAIGRPLTLVSWGAGGGGDGDNNLGEGASGGGGACAVTEIDYGETSYDFVSGTGGSAGTLGTATSGTESSWSDSGGIVNQANGGGAGIASLSIGSAIAGPGGSGGVGDVINDGGPGAVGTGNVNPGGSGGTLTAAPGIAGGDPDGIRGSTSANASPSTGGSATTGGVGRAGGHGFGRIFASTLANASYPFFDTEVTFHEDAVNTTSRDLVLAGSHVANDRLLVIGAIDGGGGTSAMSGWTTICDAANVGVDAALLVFGIDSTGSESLALTSASELGQFWMFRVKNADPVANWTITTLAKESGGNANPPSHTHPAGSKPILWITIVAFDGVAASSVAGIPQNLFPSGWDFMTNWTHPRGNTSSASGMFIAAKVSTTDTEDPPTFTHTMGTIGMTATMAIPLLGS